MTLSTIDRSSPESLAQLARVQLTTVARQHESAVQAYLSRRVRRSFDANELAEEVFFRFYATGGLDLPRERVRDRLMELSREVLEGLLQGGLPADQTAWTELCLELDDLVESRRCEPNPW